MYATCLFCSAGLGQNRQIEAFAVGRTLAFDSRLGRLWVICRGCGRWNLTPLEERWEAIEECERFFRATPLRSSTEQIGLARIGDGVDLVRIGRPSQPEFAAWRYGREFVRRRRTAYAAAAGITVVGIASIAIRHLEPALYSAVPLIGALPTMPNLWHAYRLWIRPVARIEIAGESPLIVRGSQVDQVRLLPDPAALGWQLRLPHRGGDATVTGDQAVRVLGRLLTHVNHAGSRDTVIAEAVQRLAVAGSAEAFLRDRATTMQRIGETLSAQDAVLKVALEMAVHEEAEQAAVAGDLCALEAAWREAEEVAAIADRLLLPAWMDRP